MEIEYLDDINVTAIKDNWHLIQSKSKNANYLYNNEKAIIGRVFSSVHTTYFEKIFERISETASPEISKLSKPIYLNHDDRLKTSRLMLFLTANCNLRCIYCHCDSNNKIKSNMPKSLAFKSIDKFIKEIHNIYQIDGKLKITFMGGGEPFLKLDMIKAITKYISKIGLSNVTEYTIVTNGTLGTEQDWEWLFKNKFKITISADGPPSVQNTQRKFFSSNQPTSYVIEKNLRLLGNFESNINIRSTILDSSKKNIESICDYFQQFSCVKTHQLEPVSFAGRGSSIKHENETVFYSEFFKNYSSFLFEKPSRYKSSWFRPFKRSDGFCGAAYFNAIVTHDGYISLCTEVDSSMMKKLFGKKYLCANVEDDNPFVSKNAKIFAEENSIQKLEMCQNCIIKYKCGGGCYIKKDRDFKDDSSFFKSYCINSISLVMSYLIGIYEKRLKQNQSY